MKEWFFVAWIQLRPSLRQAATTGDFITLPAGLRTFGGLQSVFTGEFYQNILSFDIISLGIIRSMSDIVRLITC